MKKMFLFSAVLLVSAYLLGSCKNEIMQPSSSSVLQPDKISTQLDIRYKDSLGNFVPISILQYQNFLIQIGDIPNQNNTLLQVSTNTFVDNGVTKHNVSTTWHSSNGKYYNNKCRVYKKSEGSKTFFVLGEINGSTTTSTCTCEGNCSNGCNAGDVICSCTPCADLTTCKKTSTVVTVTSSLFTGPL